MYVKEEMSKPPEEQDADLKPIIDGMKFGERLAFKNKIKLIDGGAVKRYKDLAAQEKKQQMQVDALEARLKVEQQRELSLMESQVGTSKQQNLNEEQLWRQVDVTICASGATGRFADAINGIYDVIPGSNSGGGSVYKHRANKSTSIEYMPSSGQWQIKSTSDLGKDISMACLSSPRPYPLRSISSRSDVSKVWSVHNGDAYTNQPGLIVRDNAVVVAEAEKAERDRLAKIEADRLAAAAAAEKAEKDRLAKLAARTRQLTFSSKGDTNGVLHFIGTKGGTVPYANPHNAAGGVVASASSVHSGKRANIVGRDNAGFYTDDVPNSYIKVDLGVGRRLILNHYYFKHGFYSSKYYIRSWRVQGSNDDSTWVTLREHNKDTTINAAYAPGSWPINLTYTTTSAAGNPTISYRYFRIIQTGPNSDGNDDLNLCCLELYGKYSWGESTAY